MSRGDRLYLEDMKASCEKVLRYTDTVTFEAFVADEKTFDAVVRNLELVGEAAKNLSRELRDDSPGVDWRRIIGLRDIVVHHYFGIDEEIIWDIVQNHVPALLIQITFILSAV